jgi:hypothetical protein
VAGLHTGEGVCRAYEAAEATVAVWTMRDSLERAREQWAGSANGGAPS